MSRSNPTDNQPHPCNRWHEWHGGDGVIEYYDKEAVNPKSPTGKGARVGVKLPFTFILLDQLSTVKGWHDASESGIFSNEVRDTKAETLVVKAHKGGILAEGLYTNIRDRVAAHGGHYVANCYIGYRDAENNLTLGSIQFKGAALNAWVEFTKKNRADLYKKAVKIVGYTEGKKGKIIFRVPKFALVDVSEKTNTEANALDMVLQAYLKGYFSRTRTEQVAKPAAPAATQVDEPPSEELPPEMADAVADDAGQPEDDSVPF